ncbi:MAG TPA: hypothetical protein VNR86_07290 [Sphingomicrobium sp.]|nr:hypothetical protein [Sphingomicrobium sp.]
MSAQFNATVQGTIDRCRRLASVTQDRKVAQELLDLAAKLEAALPPGSNDNPPGGEAL